MLDQRSRSDPQKHGYRVVIPLASKAPKRICRGKRGPGIDSEKDDHIAYRSARTKRECLRPRLVGGLDVCSHLPHFPQHVQAESYQDRQSEKRADPTSTNAYVRGRDWSVIHDGSFIGNF